MKISKTLSVIFQGIQGLLVLGFVLSLLNWNWLQVDYVVWFVIGVFWIFLNIISWVCIISPERR